MKKKLLLSIDGGGIRGIIPLYYLMYLEKELIKITGKNIVETFDMFAGTSVGSMILGTLLFRTYETKNIMSEIIENIFTDANFYYIFKDYNYSSIVGLNPKYDSKNKNDLIKKYIKDDVYFNNIGSNKHFMVPYYSITQEKPIFYKSYKESKEKHKASDIICASSSAPIYFSSYVFSDGSEIGIDGAVFANNPTDSLYADALELYNTTDIRILSLGTGDPILNPGKPNYYMGGAIEWITKGSLINIIMDSNQAVVDYKMKIFAKDNDDKYIRIHKPLNVALDDLSKIDFLKDEAMKWFVETKDKVLDLIIN